MVKSITCERVIREGLEKGHTASYAPHRARAGYVVYKMIAGPRLTADIERHVSDLDDLLLYLQAGHATRWQCQKFAALKPVVLASGKLELEVIR